MASRNLGGSTSKDKSHQRYSRGPSQTVSYAKIPLGGSTGFIHLEGTARYTAYNRLLVMTVTGKRSPGNMGPGIHVQETATEWLRTKNADGSARKTLSAFLGRVAARIVGRTYPERGMFVGKCNTSGQEFTQFLQSTCASCSCWYCDLV